MKTPEYLIGSEIVRPTDYDFEQKIESAYNQKIRPRCVCKAPPVEMYIARLNNGHIVKKMPDSGSKHHPSCQSYDMPPELSGRSELDTAIKREGEDVNLRVDFSLTKSSVTRDMTVTDSSTVKEEVKAEPKKLGIRSLLQFLYEEAEFNKWHPKMEGKRNWYIVRKYLLAATEHKQTKRQELKNVLLLPESFQIDRKDEIIAARAKFVSQFGSDKSNKQKLGILVGELKDIEPSRFGGKITIKHMPEKNLFADKTLFKKINKAFEKELCFFEQDENVHLLIICTFYISITGYLQVDTFSCMLVDENWLPFDNLDELELNNKLVSAKRSFIKNQRYNLSENAIFASALLTDCFEPTAIFTIPAEASEQYYDQLEEIRQSSEFDSFIWDKNESCEVSLPEAAK